jgi:hypothetical protein
MKEWNYSPRVVAKKRVADSKRRPERPGNHNPGQNTMA